MMPSCSKACLMIGVNALIGGYLIAGRMTVRYADHEEVVGAGELYYMAAGDAGIRGHDR